VTGVDLIPAPPTEAAGAGLALANLSPARRAILSTLKKRGHATADELAAAIDVTVSAVRQHLAALTAEGLVAHGEQRGGPGRPRHVYRLAPAAEVLFPKRYGELTNQLLGFIEDTDPRIVAEAFERRRAARVAQAQPRLEGKTFDQRVRELAAILDEDGYLAEAERCADGSWMVTEHNCAVLDVARRYGQACVSEIEFIREVLPEAEVERVHHIVAGAHVCAYAIRPRSRRGAARPTA
jgi:DeoR family suf operon transcriptional repressor